MQAFGGGRLCQWFLGTLLARRLGAMGRGFPHFTHPVTVGRGTVLTRQPLGAQVPGPAVSRVGTMGDADQGRELSNHTSGAGPGVSLFLDRSGCMQRLLSSLNPGHKGSVLVCRLLPPIKTQLSQRSCPLAPPLVEQVDQIQRILPVCQTFQKFLFQESVCWSSSYSLSSM